MVVQGLRIEVAHSGWLSGALATATKSAQRPPPVSPLSSALSWERSLS